MGGILRPVPDDPARSEPNRTERDGFVSADSQAKSPIQDLFKQQFGRVAADKAKFDAFMQQVFGKGHDRNLAQQYRQKALAGDFCWLPPVEFVAGHALQGANGAYDSQRGVVYINSDLKGNPARTASVYVEEAGHCIDSRINTTDTVGDEGEMFRRILSGEKLNSAQITEIRTDDDHGMINVNGRQVAVEFWNPFKAIGDAVKNVGGAIVDGAQGIYNGVKEVGKGVVGGVTGFCGGIGEFFGNLFQGRVGNAFDSLIRGADKAFLQAPARVLNGLINGAAMWLGPVGRPVQWLTSHAADIGRTALNTGVGIGRDVYRIATETPMGFAIDLTQSVGLLFQAKFADRPRSSGWPSQASPAASSAA